METIIDYFSRLRGYDWWGVPIELFVIGLVVYWVVDFLEGTRGERLFRGVLFILVAGVLILNLVVERLDLIRLQFLYKSFLLAVLIIAVAAFQPELRRAMIRIGQPKFTKGASQQLAITLEEIIAAVVHLSASKIGAVIVLERRVALGEFTEIGVKINSIVSSELLRSIFHPGSALHDMAVVIRGDRIVAARIQLPLAEEGSLKGIELGSRHRAAIGITSGSDAVCLVVSEETGAISIAEEAILTRGLNESQLRTRLTTSMEQMIPVTERFRGLFRKKSLSSTHQT